MSAPGSPRLRESARAPVRGGRQAGREGQSESESERERKREREKEEEERDGWMEGGRAKALASII